LGISDGWNEQAFVLYALWHAPAPTRTHTDRRTDTETDRLTDRRPSAAESAAPRAVSDEEDEMTASRENS
jgi:hypothetical protein